MATYNRTTRVKRGQTGHVVIVTFYDEDGELFDLTGHTVVFEVTAANDATNLLENTSMTLLNQTTHTGQATYTMTATDALLTAGTYDWEARATHTASGRVRIAPNVAGSEYGTFILVESKVGA